MTGSLSERFHDAYEASRLSGPELWLRYLALGGEASELEIDAYLNGAIALPAFQHDMWPTPSTNVSTRSPLRKHLTATSSCPSMSSADPMGRRSLSGMPVRNVRP